MSMFGLHLCHTEEGVSLFCCYIYYLNEYTWVTHGHVLQCSSDNLTFMFRSTIVSKWTFFCINNIDTCLNYGFFLIN